MKILRIIDSMLLRIASRIVAKHQKNTVAVSPAPRPQPTRRTKLRPLILPTKVHAAVLVQALREYQASNESLLHGWEVAGGSEDVKQLTDLLTLYGIAAELETELLQLDKNPNDTL